MSVESLSPLDVNLALFEILGRLALAGLWNHWLGERGFVDEAAAHAATMRLTEAGLALIRNNPTLLLPISDRQGTDIALFLLLWLASGLKGDQVSQWLVNMAHRLAFTIRVRGRYPAVASDYRELADHPRDKSGEYFKEGTAGSTVIPLIDAWLPAVGRVDVVEDLSDLVREELDHCTLQV